MKKVGIWIDKEKAYIVTLYKDSEKFRTLESELEDLSMYMVGLVQKQDGGHKTLFRTASI